MASFTDQPHGFNPYVAQLPVEAMVTVGARKEQEFQLGVQKVQSYVDSLENLDIIKDEDKQYVHQKLGQIREGISKNLSGDFGDQRITNQIGGAIKLVAKDPVVQNGVISTATYRKGISDIEAARKAGKSSIQNEWDFNTDASAWLSDQQSGTKFQKSFTQYTDVNKKWMEIQKELGANETSRDLPFLMDSTNTYYVDEKGNKVDKPVLSSVMIRKTFKGKDPTQIKQAIMASMDENDINQLRIDGRYHYKDVPTSELADVIIKDQKAISEESSKYIGYLETLKTLNPTDLAYQKEVDAKLEAAKQAHQASQESFNKTIQLAQDNPEAFKSNFYIQKAVNNFSTSWSNHSDLQQIIESPYQAKADKDRTYALSVNRFQEDQRHNKVTESISIENLKVNQEELKIKKEEKLGIGTGVLVPGSLTQGASNNITKPTATAFADDLEATRVAITKNTADFKNKNFPNTSEKEFNAKLAFYQDAYNNGKEVPAYWRDYLDNTKTMQTSYNEGAALINKIQKQADENFKTEEKEIIKGIPTFKLGPHTITPTALVSATVELSNMAESLAASKGQGEDYLISKLSPTARSLYDATQAHGQGAENVKKILAEVRTNATSKMKDVSKRKTDWINTQVAEKSIFYQPQSFGFNAAKPENIAFAKAGVNQYITRIENEGGKVGTGPMAKNFNLTDAKYLLDDPKTKMGVIRQGNDVFITMQGVDSKNKPLPLQVIPTNADEFSGVFGQGVAAPNQKVADVIYQNGNTNIESGSSGAQLLTNPNAYKTAKFAKIRGGSKLDAFPAVKKYNVKSDILELSKGSYQLILYVQNDKGDWKTLESIQSPSINTLLDVLPTVTDKTIEPLIK